MDENYKEFIRLLGYLYQRLDKLICAYGLAAENLIESKICNREEIEKILDCVVEFTRFPKGLEIFKKLCNYYYSFNPEAAGIYLLYYKKICEDEDRGVSLKM